MVKLLEPQRQVFSGSLFSMNWDIVRIGFPFRITPDGSHSSGVSVLTATTATGEHSQTDSGSRADDGAPGSFAFAKIGRPIFRDLRVTSLGVNPSFAAVAWIRSSSSGEMRVT